MQPKEEPVQAECRIVVHEEEELLGVCIVLIQMLQSSVALSAVPAHLPLLIKYLGFQKRTNGQREVSLCIGVGSMFRQEPTHLAPLLAKVYYAQLHVFAV